MTNNIPLVAHHRDVNLKCLAKHILQHESLKTNISTLFMYKLVSKAIIFIIGKQVFGVLGV